MLHLKNIRSGNPKTPEQWELTKRLGVIWLYDETGKKWYEEQKNFQADTIKFGYDADGIIRWKVKDITSINPDSLSVVEVPDVIINRRVECNGEWMFKDGSAIKRIYTPDELSQRAESKKAVLLSEAETVIKPLERAVKLKIATDLERLRLEAWEGYSVMISRVDTNNPIWPEKPQI